MSVLRRPRGLALQFLTVLFCLVSVFALMAQEEVNNATSDAVEVTIDAANAIEAKENVPETNTVVTEAVNAISETNPVAAEATEAIGNANKAISIEVTPADEVIPEQDSSNAVVLSEEIPAANPDSEIDKAIAAAEKALSDAGNDTLAVENAAVEVTPAQEEIIIGNASIEVIPAENTIVDTSKVEEAVAESVEAPKAEEAVVESVEAPKAEEAVSQSVEVIPAPAEMNTRNKNEAVSTDKQPKKLYYFESERGSTLAVIIILMVFVSYYTFQAQRGKEMFIRRIGGLSAVEDAVGRATEMGRGVLYVPGIADMDDIQTIAGVTILGHVARKTAEYDTDLYAPMCRSFVMSVAQEVVKQAYLEKGRVDAYRPDRINYLTDDQFGYVAGVGGVMMRDKPAACFYLGTFYAESLILAETGNAVGAIQIAGTAEPSQIPFFVAACDYTLIGEELFAASAYLSKNPREVGSLKGQDMVKVVIIIAIIIGTLLVTISETKAGKNSVFSTMANTYMEYLK